MIRAEASRFPYGLPLLRWKALFLSTHSASLDLANFKAAVFSRPSLGAKREGRFTISLL